MSKNVETTSNLEETVTDGSSRPYVLVTTKDRGVFVGFLEDVGKADPALPPSVPTPDLALCQVRMVVRWNVETRSVLGLASKGPAAGCRIGPPGPLGYLYGITGVFAVSPAAHEAIQNLEW